MIRFIPWLTLTLAILFAASPLFTDPFTGFRADQLPVPQIDPPVQPAGYAFAIWGLIYGWLILSAGFGIWARRDDPAWTRAQIPLCISLAIGVPWLAIANASAVWATITIVLMAVFAIAAMVRSPSGDRWLFLAPTGLYAGWLTAASGVSIATTLAGYGILMGQTGWAIVALLLAQLVAVTIHALRPDAQSYLAAIIWAFVGIAVANGTSQSWVLAFAVAGVLSLGVRAATSVFRPS